MTELDDQAFDFYAHHWDPRAPGEADLRAAAIEELPVRCPVTKSDAYGGFWMVSSYDAVLGIFRDWQSFSNNPVRAFFGRPAERPPMPPIDLDRPVQREYRQLLDPMFTPKRLAPFEPGIRALVTELIDEFIEDGRCDFAGQFALQFPGRMLYKFLFGIDDSDVMRVKRWTELSLDDPHGPIGQDAQVKWNDWLYQLIESRRAAPRRDDIIDRLLCGQIEGRPLTDREIVGCLQVLILGGLGTTADVLLNTIIRLCAGRELQEYLRAHPERIEIDEFVRMDTPVGVATRLCTRQAVIEGQTVEPGDRVLVFSAAAHRDPKEFSDPNTLKLGRSPNRHLGFGAGPHRCLGSNVARLNFRIAMEEILSRMTDLRITPGDAPRREEPQALTFSIKYLPLSFTPGPRRGASG
jgi:cytochrome P450